MNQKRGKQGSHSAQVPRNIRVMDSPKVACNKQKPAFYVPFWFCFQIQTIVCDSCVFCTDAQETKHRRA